VYDVTRGDFSTFVEKTGYQTDADKLNQNHPGSSFTWRDPGFEQTDSHPVVMVSWMDAIAFCDWLSKSDGRRYRLPLESEWEYACRGGAASYTPFNTGEKLDPDEANIGTDTFHPGGTTPVGHFKPNAFGLCDMHGNVFQWCYTAEPDRAFNQVMYPDQQTSQELNNKRVMRGGSWLLPAVDARSASRTSDWAQGFSRDRGFRIVLEPLTK
jgi:formylglycine-generating enzyme required for sulfatase activity